MTNDEGRERRGAGGLVFLWLAVLTCLEYVIGVRVRHPLPFILPIVVVMAVLILRYVMRIDELWGGGDR